MKNLQDSILLNNEMKIPQLGLGCFNAKGNVIYDAVRWAVDAGYRHIDTATRYENEREVGRAIRESSVSRENLFVVSKMWPTRFENPSAAIEYSLKELDIDYIDSYLLHWPGTNEAARFRAWETILNYIEKKKILSAGVSNFQISHLQGLIDEFGLIPVLNQIELHPWFQQQELCDFCRSHNIAVTAWGPIFRGHISEVELMNELAKKYDKSPVQVALRWHLQHGNIIIPKSSKRERIIDNSLLFDFVLSEEDMKKIDGLECGRHFGNDPNTFDGGDF